MARLAQETAELIRPSIPPGIQLELETAPASHFVEGDPDQLTQVLVNLLGNARDSLTESGASGRICLRAGAVPETLSPPESLAGKKLVAWIVTDDGHGFPETILQHLFEPFFTTKGAGKGTGLGLWNCLGTIRAHHGEILAQNLAGRGARITVLLPAAEDAPQSAVEPDLPAEPEPDSTESVNTPFVHRILLVDDEETIREHGALSLRENGFEVVVAGSGERALERFADEGQGFSLVILDLSLPGISGRETCARILERNPCQAVLIVTGYDLGSGQAEPEVSGAAARLLKPFRMSRLIEESRRLCAKAS